MTKGERIKNKRIEKGLSQLELAEKADTTKQTIYKYEMGIITNIPSDKVELLANALNVSPAYIMGWDDSTLPANVTPVTVTDDVVTIPVYGNVAAGQGCYADDNIIDYMDVPQEWIKNSKEYAILKVDGDSMQPEIQDGDFALIRQQTSVDSGSYAVALIDDENGVIKRVLYGTNWIELQSVNPMYAPRRFENEDVQRIRIFGLVKKIIRNYD